MERMNDSRVITIAEGPIRRAVDDDSVIVVVKNLHLDRYIIVDLRVVASLEKYLDIVLPKAVSKLAVVLSTQRIGNHADIKLIINKVRKDAVSTFLFSDKLKENIMIIFY